MHLYKGGAASKAFLTETAVVCDITATLSKVLWREVVHVYASNGDDYDEDEMISDFLKLKHHESGNFPQQQSPMLKVAMDRMLGILSFQYQESTFNN